MMIAQRLILIRRSVLTTLSPVVLVVPGAVAEQTFSDDVALLKETGLPSIWLLGMYKPGPEITTVIPIGKGVEKQLDPLAQKLLGVSIEEIKSALK